MTRIARRDMLTTSLAGGLLLGLPRPARANLLRLPGPNAEIRFAVVGLGGIDTVGGVGGRGRQLVSRLGEVPGVRVVALCDVDEEILRHEVEQFQKRKESVIAYRDMRRVFDDKTIDAVAIATPNHWHALATVWACQAGKDVYVEKPFSYNIWEGRQMIAAARKYGRMVQVGTQRRSSTALPQAFEFLSSGEIGPIRCAYALMYRAREGIGKVAVPTPPPASVDYDLWCGPAPKMALRRQQLHYDWHWFWSTGNGEIGNNGAHMIDLGRWALGQSQPPARAMSIGGRFGFQDDGETPNTQIAIFDYQPSPLICEIRNLRVGQDASLMGRFRGADRGIVVDCEGGYFVGDAAGGTVCDRQGNKIKEILDPLKPQEMETLHLANFVAAVRSRNVSELNAEAAVGHVSAACSHMANISHRLGKLCDPQQIVEITRASRELSETFDRCRGYLQANGVDLGKSQAVAGPWVKLDPVRECFVQELADEANQLSQRAYRQPFVVPTM